MIELVIHYKKIKQTGIRPIHTCPEMHSNKALRENIMALENETLKQFWNSPSQVDILLKRNDTANKKAVYNLYFMKLLIFETCLSLKHPFFLKAKSRFALCVSTKDEENT